MVCAPVSDGEGMAGLSWTTCTRRWGWCANPIGKLGQAGVIAQGGAVRIHAGEGPSGNVPEFANTGKKEYHYYIVGRHNKSGPSNPLYAGSALTNGSGNITVTTPDIAGANSFDLLRVTPPTDLREQAPYETGNYAVATNVARSSACANG